MKALFAFALILLGAFLWLAGKGLWLLFTGSIGLGTAYAFFGTVVSVGISILLVSICVYYHREIKKLERHE